MKITKKIIITAITVVLCLTLVSCNSDIFTSSDDENKSESSATEQITTTLDNIDSDESSEKDQTTGNYKDDFINALVNNQDSWNTPLSGDGSSSTTQIYFMDINLDDKLELVTEYFPGTGGTCVEVYGYENNKIIHYNIDKDATLINSFNYYYDTSENKYRIFGTDTTAYCSNTSQSHKDISNYELVVIGDTIYKDFYTSYCPIDGYSVLQRKASPVDGYIEGEYNYNILGPQSDKQSYDKTNSERFKSCIDVDITRNTITSDDWKNYSNSEKKQELEKAYDSFTMEKEENHNENYDKIYSSNIIQEYSNEVYYCSSDGSPEIMNLPRLDFSSTDLGYKKIPVTVDGGVHSFIIYDEHIYYICEYQNRTNSQGLYSAGKLYRCDLSGDNNILISDNVTNLCFQITDNQLYYNTVGNTANQDSYNSYNLKTEAKTVINDYESVGEFKLGWLFRFDDKSGNYTEFDGGYYYYAADNSGNIETINGEHANVYYYRKDIETGEVQKIGYSYNQTY